MPQKYLALAEEPGDRQGEGEVGIFHFGDGGVGGGRQQKAFHGLCLALSEQEELLLCGSRGKAGRASSEHQTTSYSALYTRFPAVPKSGQAINRIE
jgi:hypothetical protein